MARRASSSLHPGIFIGITVLVVFAIVAGRHFLKQRKQGFSETTPLNIEEVLANGNSLRGNEYAVEGKIDDKLRWTTSRGQVVSLRVTTPGGEETIPILIPKEFNNLNIEREQRYTMRVKYHQGGTAVATAVKRL